jgi:hypothetical protein
MIKLSKHITDEMDGRGITRHYIEAAVLTPDWVTRDPTQPALTRSFKTIAAFGHRVIRVVHRPDDDGIFIVTAHWDRGAKR